MRRCLLVLGLVALPVALVVPGAVAEDAQLCVDVVVDVEGAPIAVDEHHCVPGEEEPQLPDPGEVPLPPLPGLGL